MARNSTLDVIRVLLVDDDEEDYLIIKHLFGSMSTIACELEWVSSSEAAIAAIEQRRHDAYLVDYRLDGRTGLDVLHEVNAYERIEPFILLTGVENQEVERMSLEEAAADFLVKKDLTSDNLAKTLYYALGRKEQERQKLEQVLALARSKDEFISIASHQLRTPATTVKQYIAMVLDGMGGDLSAKQRTLLEKAYDSNERQLTIVNNLLKVAQVDSGQVNLVRKRTDVGQLVARAVADFEPFFAETSQSLASDILHGVEAEVDENALRMVLDNLLENAQKYSPAGSKTRVEVTTSSPGWLEIIIADEGVGVDQPEQLFRKFTRIENERSTEVGGTGIGLYWAQSIAQLHGGDIVYEPNTPRGSRFLLCLPRV